MGIFDGMGRTMCNVFGSTVTITPVVGAPYEVTAIFREDPLQIENRHGGTTSAINPILRARSDQISGLMPGDQVGPIAGKSYRVISALTMGSPASDGLVEIELELT